MMSDVVRVLLVEDDRDFAFLIQKLIDKDDKLEFAGHADCRALGVEMAHRLKPNVVVMDLNLYGSELDGIDAAKEIRLATDAKVLLLTSYEQPEIIIEASKKAFASGYIFKSQCHTIADTIYKTAVSDTPQALFIKELLLSGLSAAERGVLNDLIEGNIQTLTSSSLKTIANQKTSIFKKIGVKSTGELVRLLKNW